MKDVRKSRKKQTKTDAWAVEVTLKNLYTLKAGDFQDNRNWTDILILHHNITNITL